MIITITGKPCSGKDVLIDIFCQKYNFKPISMGKIFRSAAKKLGYTSIADFQTAEQTKEVDAAVDGRLVKIGKKQLNDDLIIASRTAWHFIPNSFKVYLNVDLDVAANRLLESKRDSEPVKNITQAKRVLKSRYVSENKRYKQIYGIDCTNLNNFDFVLDSSVKTPTQLATMLYKAYTKFVKSKK